MPKHTPEEIAAHNRLAVNKNRVRKLLVAGQLDRAKAVAKKHGFDFWSARLAPEYKSDAEPFFAKLEAGRPADDAKPAEPPPAPDQIPSSPARPLMVDGWPVETSAVIWGFPPNQNLVIIELPDKRRVSMWKGRGNIWQIYDKCWAQLESTKADPIYAPMPRPRREG